MTSHVVTEHDSTHARWSTSRRFSTVYPKPEAACAYLLLDIINATLKAVTTLTNSTSTPPTWFDNCTTAPNHNYDVQRLNQGCYSCICHWDDFVHIYACPFIPVDNCISVHFQHVHNFIRPWVLSMYCCYEHFEGFIWLYDHMAVLEMAWL